MLEVQSYKGDGHSGAHSRSSEAVLGPPPVYDDICRFVAEYAGRLPRNVFTGTAPYEYTGCDYALILYAIMPSKCIDLSSLCWSTTPLPAQLEANLAVFCEGCRGLQLCDAPLSSLNPQCLRCSPTCIVHHIKVQHWLFVLSQRFQPEGSFDAVALRMELRHAQLGEPRLATSHTLPCTDVNIAGRSGEDALTLASLHCHAIWKAPAVPLPEKTERDTAAASKATAKTRRGADDDETQRRPWRSATRPLRTAPTTKSAPQKTSRTLHASPPSTNDCPTVSTSTYHNLADQWSDSERRRLQLKESLAHARQVLQCTFFANGTIDFDDILSILKQKQQ